MAMDNSTVWLAYGMNADGGLVSVQDVIGGRTDLMCPYCHGLLTAKKGKVKSPHFAHTGETCDRVRRGKIPILPMYDRFNLHLTGREVEVLQTYWDLYGVHNWAGPWSDMAAKLEKKGFLQANVYRPRGWFEFTKLGKIPIGVLSLNLFSQVQEPMIMKQYDQLAYLAEKHPDDETSQTDFRIYVAQLRRILAATLYFVEVELDGSILHKIGVTRATWIEPREGDHPGPDTVRSAVHAGQSEGARDLAAPWQYRALLQASLCQAAGQAARIADRVFCLRRSQGGLTGFEAHAAERIDTGREANPECRCSHAGRSVAVGIRRYDRNGRGEGYSETQERNWKRLVILNFSEMKFYI